ncbi:MAG: NifU family protein [Flavobacteriales bacterium]
MPSTEKQTPAQVFAELTPNPSSMKFVADRALVDEEGTCVEFETLEEAKGYSPLAEQLFQFPFVTNVFMMNDFVTVNKNEVVEWEEVTNELREFIRDHLNEGGEVLLRMPDEKKAPAEDGNMKEDKPSSSDGEETKKPVDSLFGEGPSSPHDGHIKELLSEYVAPAVQGDGGAIHFHSFQDGVVKLVLKGACSGCPSSTETLKDGVEMLLKEHIPEVERVEAIAE